MKDVDFDDGFETESLDMLADQFEEEYIEEYDDQRDLFAEADWMRENDYHSHNHDHWNGY